VLSHVIAIDWLTVCRKKSDVGRIARGCHRTCSISDLLGPRVRLLPLKLSRIRNCIVDCPFCCAMTVWSVIPNLLNLIIHCSVKLNNVVKIHFKWRLGENAKGRSLRLEGPKEAKGRERRGVLGVAAPSPPARGCGERCKLPQRDPSGALAKNEFSAF